MANQPVDQGKRRFLIAATTAVGGVAAVAVAVPFVTSMLPSARAKAAGAPVEVDVSKIEPGAMITVEWRGKPVWVVSLTDDMAKTLSGHDDNLADPKLEVTSQQPEYCKNPTRSIRPNLMVMEGVCTHLGCSPSPKLQPGGDMGGAVGKFDLAGRVFKGSPAPTNLVVPPHKYLSDAILLIGEHSEGAV